VLINPAGRIPPPRGKPQQAAAQPIALPAETAAQHLHRSPIRQGLIQGQGTLRKQQGVDPLIGGQTGQSPLRIRQLGQQAPLLVGLKLVPGWDGRLQHEQPLLLRWQIRPSGTELLLRARQRRQAQQMGTQYHQRGEQQPAAPRTDRRYGTPEAPSH